MVEEKDLGWWETRASSTITIVEDEKDNFSGLYDQHGSKLYRKKEPMGFIK